MLLHIVCFSIESFSLQGMLLHIMLLFTQHASLTCDLHHPQMYDLFQTSNLTYAARGDTSTSSKRQIHANSTCQIHANRGDTSNSMHLDERTLCRSMQCNVSQLLTRGRAHAKAGLGVKVGERTALAGPAESRVERRPSPAIHNRQTGGRRLAAAHKEHVEALPWTAEEVGVVVVDHGSRAAASNQMLLDFVGMFK